MAETLPDTRRRRRIPMVLIALTAIGAANFAAWVHFRNRQPETDERTRARLQRRGGRA